MRKNSVSLRLRETRDLFYKKTPHDDNSTLNVGDARLFPRGDVFNAHATFSVFFFPLTLRDSAHQSGNQECIV